jgi:hypothetical protein
VRYLPIALTLALAAPAARAADPVRPWSGPRTVVKVKHLVPVMHDADEYWDKYTFSSDLGDRGSFYFSAGITNLGLGSGKLELKARLTVDGRKFESKLQKDHDDWKLDKGDTFTLSAEKASMSGNPDQLVFKNEVGGDAFEVTFTPVVRPWRPRDGQVTFGKDQKVFDVTMFPLCKVHIHYKQDGGEWKDLDATGWGSHTWGDQMMYSEARWTLDLHAIQGDYTIYMRELGLNDQYGGLRIPYLLITKGNSILIESYDYQFNATSVFTDEQHENKYRVPEEFTLLGKDAEDANRMFRAVVKKKALKKRDDVLASMGGLKAAVVGRYAKPVEYDYDVDYTFEVKNGDDVQRIQGVGVYEVNQLNK